MTVIGEISYTNILPFFFYLDRARLMKHSCRFVPQVPSQLNEAMAVGKVDVGGISSFAYAQQPAAYTLLPDLSVSSYGKVGSIFLFSRVPLEELNEKRIALTSSSATSVHLLKVILEYFYKLENTYTTMTPHLDKMLVEHDACLLIGDDAIRATWNKGSHLYQYDLGELWYKHTGFPMVYAVFAVRNQLVFQDADIVGELYRSFLASKNKSIQLRHEPMIQQIMSTIGGDKSFWDTYFAGLCYDFSEKEQQGLLYYYKLVYECGFLEKPVETIHVWGSVRQ
ncbi:menaquinone biosynthetic enzyme MqnA/MqnD family protein [Halalkalibacter urbisdiaboli]|uniref:menaquinone biosynthetic enzyme MqnA/MqnD family protein n=1 Tax=Halalkalibacter urbisdiaboli TaxID=1960589 RepID=UPI000B44CB2A|nr:menaquinone biosynthesis protein [Halalkalibacter urbisdiaboli]